MNRIQRIFRDLRASDGRALMPFITAGDPDVATTGRLLPALEQAGASVVELGIPFSDPVADGPTIEASMSYALEHGARVAQIFEQIAAVRSSVELGVVAMVSYSIVHRIGPDRFVRDAAAAGVDGLIVPDLPLEEAAGLGQLVREADLVLSMLVAPTTPIDRARRIAQAGSGFVYVVSRAGITGEQAQLPPELADRLAALRQATDLPLAVGFGISTAEQVRQVTSVADAAIVGSALVRRIAQVRQQGPDAVIQAATAFTRELAAGLSGAPAGA